MVLCSVLHKTPLSYTTDNHRDTRPLLFAFLKDVGIATMLKGEKAVFTISPEYGYGAAGAGGVIPPNATLLFEVELLEVRIGHGHCPHSICHNPSHSARKTAPTPPSKLQWM